MSDGGDPPSNVWIGYSCDENVFDIDEITFEVFIGHNYYNSGDTGSSGLIFIHEGSINFNNIKNETNIHTIMVVNDFTSKTYKATLDKNYYIDYKASVNITIPKVVIRGDSGYFNLGIKIPGGSEFFAVEIHYKVENNIVTLMS